MRSAQSCRPAEVSTSPVQALALRWPVRITATGGREDVDSLNAEVKCELCGAGVGSGWGERCNRCRRLQVDTLRRQGVSEADIFGVFDRQFLLWYASRRSCLVLSVEAREGGA